MKLRLQIAEMLPASRKLGPDEPHGGGTFGAAMQEMMATPTSGKPSLVETPPAFPGKQSQTHPETARPDQPIHIPATETHGVSKVPPLAGILAATSQPAVQSEAPDDQNTQRTGPEVQNPDLKISRPLELPREHAKHVPMDPARLIQSSVIRELRGTSPDDTSIGEPPPRTRHKNDEPTQPADSQGSGVLPVVLQSLEFIIPVPALQPQEPAPQPDGSQPVSLKSRSKSIKGAATDLDASRPTPVPATSVMHSDLRATSPATPGYLTLLSLPATATGRADNVPESIPSNGITEGSTRTHLAPQPIGKANPGVAVPPNQTFHPQSALSVNGVDTNANQTNIHAPKEVERKTASEAKPEVRFSVSGYLTPTPPIVQHQASPHVSSTVTSGAERTIAPHRTEGSAAQVLQRMDLGSSSGAVQLRVDARRLDVGISSDALGWVEVRATTSASGRVDATLHVQNDASAQVLTSQSREISDYAREHSVPLGQVSVGVGTGDSAQRQSHSTPMREGNGSRLRGTAVRPLSDTQQTHHVPDAVSLISVRA